MVVIVIAVSVAVMASIMIGSMIIVGNFRVVCSVYHSWCGSIGACIAANGKIEA